MRDEFNSFNYTETEGNDNMTEGTASETHVETSNESENQTFADTPNESENQVFAETSNEFGNQTFTETSSESDDDNFTETPEEAVNPYKMSFVPGEQNQENTQNEQKQVAESKHTKKAKAKKTKKEKKQHGFAYRVMTSAACAVVFGAVAVGTMYVGGDKLGILNKNSSNTQKITLATTGTTAVKSDSDDGIKTTGTSTSASGVVATDVSSIVDNTMPSIVAITSTQLVKNGYDDLFSYYFGRDNNSYSEQTGAGSGIIIGKNDTELLIVTNNHVVEDSDSLQVQFIDEETVDAQIKGTDSDKDLAVVAVKLEDIKSSTLEQIKVATLGESDELKVGDATIAIGNALGYGQSVTTGVVSALNREFEYENKKMNLIQTDAAINPGNSGGALLNINGEVIGINSAKYASSTVEGMGFAIPVSDVKDIIEDLMNEETKTKVDEAKKGYINIMARDVTDDMAQAYDAPTGVLVAEVVKNGAAEKAGIQKYDIITKINGKSVSSVDDMTGQLAYYEKGEKVKVTLQRLQNGEYKEQQITVTLGGEMDK